MKIEEQVLTIEKMNHLKKLGLEVKDTAMAWYPPCHYDERHHPYYLQDDERRYNVAINEGEMLAIPTLTLREILEMLPKEIKCENRDWHLSHDMYYDVIFYASSGHGYLKAFQNTMLIAAYNMLCWCAENGYLNASNSMSLNKE